MANMEYEISETRNYLILEKLFKDSGLEFNLGKNGLYPWGFVKAFCCKNVDDNIIAGSSITFRKGNYILNDIAVAEEFRSMNIGESLLAVTEKELYNIAQTSSHILSFPQDYALILLLIFLLISKNSFDAGMHFL